MNIEEEDKLTATRILAVSGDVEIDHDSADALLCDLLRRLGFVRTVEAFDSIEKWYA